MNLDEPIIGSSKVSEEMLMTQEDTKRRAVPPADRCSGFPRNSSLSIFAIAGLTAATAALASCRDHRPTFLGLPINRVVALDGQRAFTFASSLGEIQGMPLPRLYSTGPKKPRLYPGPTWFNYISSQAGTSRR